jgi:hypothetical protein
MEMSSTDLMGSPTPMQMPPHPQEAKVGEGDLEKEYEKVRRMFPEEYRKGFMEGMEVGIRMFFNSKVYWLSLVPYQICDDHNLAADYSKSIVSVLKWLEKETVEEVKREKVERLLLHLYYWPYYDKYLEKENEEAKVDWHTLGLVKGVASGFSWARATLLEFLCTRPADGEFFYPEPFVEKFRKIIMEY